MGVPVPFVTSPQNTWSALRVVNDTANLIYVEFRAQVRRPACREGRGWMGGCDCDTHITGP